MQDDIADEIKRQFDKTIDRGHSVDTKIGLMLGFLFVTLGLLLDKDFLSLVAMSSPIIIISFVIGLALVICSVITGLRAYYFRNYDFGPRVSELWRDYECRKEKDPNYDFKEPISKELHKAVDTNNAVVNNKAKYAEVMFITFSVGLLVIIILKVGCFSKLW